MKISLTALTALATCMFLAASGHLFAQDKEARPDVSYFTKLRMDFSKKADFNPLWKMEGQRQAVIDAYKLKDYAKVSDLAKAWLEKCPVDAEVHSMRGQALMHLGDITHYSSELYFFYGLIHSIASSGDGQSAETAFKVISAEEEYYLLSDFGAEPTGQSMQKDCDVIRCKLEDGKEVTYYFDTSIALAAEEKLAPAPPKK